MQPPEDPATDWWQKGLGLFRHATGMLNTYTGFSLLAQLGNMAATVLLLRWLPPSQMGMWQSMLLIETYCLGLRFGVINGMNRQLPYLLGRGQKEGAQKCFAITFAYTLILAVVLALAFATAAMLRPVADDWRLSWFTLAIYTPAGLYAAFNEATFRSNQSFALLGRLMLANSLLGLALLPLVAQFGYTGHCARLTIGVTFYAGMTHFLRPVRGRPALDWSTMRELLRVGLPLYASNYLARLSLSVGPLILLYLGGTTSLGYYAPVTAVTSLMLVLPNVLQSYALPRQNFEFGQHHSTARVVDGAIRSTSGLLLGLLPVGVVVVVVLPPFVTLAAPHYLPAISAMQWAVAYGLIRVFGICSTVYSTLMAWRPMFLNQFALYAMQGLGALAGALAWREAPWLGVIIGMFVAYLFYIPLTIRSLRSLAVDLA